MIWPGDLDELDRMTDWLCSILEGLTNSEFDPLLWRDDPDMDLVARTLRDLELFLDLTGNIDSGV